MSPDKTMYEQVGKLPVAYLHIYNMLRLTGIPPKAAEALARKTYMSQLEDNQQYHDGESL